MSLGMVTARYMLLERRLFADWWAIPDISLHIAADASPSTGCEILGILVDMFKYGVLHHIILPGVTLGHGFMDLIDKAMALLWAAWLITGPAMTGLENFCRAVRT